MPAAEGRLTLRRAADGTVVRAGPQPVSIPVRPSATQQGVFTPRTRMSGTIPGLVQASGAQFGGGTADMVLATDEVGDRIRRQER
jgi:hypothetical protein